MGVGESGGADADSIRGRYERRVRALVDGGPRGSATPGERRAADYLAGELAAIGLEPAIEPFPGGRSLGARLLLHVGVAALGAALLWRAPAATILLGAIALGSLIAESTTRVRVLGRPLMRGRSANVSARVAAIGGEARLRIVVCGHHDAQKTGLLWDEGAWARLAPILARLPAWAQSPFNSVASAMIGQIVVGLVALADADRAAVTVAGAMILVVYGVAGLLLADWSVGATVPGASDNASGAAAVLALAEAWAASPADRVELVLLSTGCEETGLLGASAWADAHREEVRRLPTAFLNLDGLGFGPPRFLGREIPLAGPPATYPGPLLALAGRAAAGRGLTDAGPQTVAGFTDGLAFLARGIPGLTVVGSRADGRLPHWHRPTDTVDRMDLDSAWLGVEFAADLLRGLASTAPSDPSPIGGAPTRPGTPP